MNKWKYKQSGMEKGNESKQFLDLEAEDEEEEEQSPDDDSNENNSLSDSASLPNSKPPTKSHNNDGLRTLGFIDEEDEADSKDNSPTSMKENKKAANGDYDGKASYMNHKTNKKNKNQM